MSLKSLTVTHDPEEGCSKCVFCDHEYSLCQFYSALGNNLDDPAPDWCPFRAAPEAPEAVFDCPAGYLMSAHGFAPEASPLASETARRGPCPREDPDTRL